MPVIETIQNQRRFLDEQLYIAQKFGANLRVWSDSIQALYRSVQLIEASSDLKGRLEVAVPNTEKANKLTWKDVFVIFSLFQLLFFVEDHAKPNVVYFINQISA